MTLDNIILVRMMEVAKDWLSHKLAHLALHPRDIEIGVQVVRRGETKGKHYIIAHLDGAQVVNMTQGDVVSRALTIKVGDGAILTINF